MSPNDSAQGTPGDGQRAQSTAIGSAQKSAADNSEQAEKNEDNEPSVALDRISLIKSHADSLAKICVDGVELSEDTKLAYFRASKGDIDQANHRLKESMKWRAEMDIENVMSDPTWLEKERKCRPLLMYDYLGTDRYGRSVMVERVGRWNVPDVLDTAKSDPVAFLKLHCMACETLLRMPRPAETVDTRGQVVIMDCMGLSVRHLDPRLANVFGRLAMSDAAHYPDTLAHIFVVNAPYCFAALATLILPFLDPDTYSKVYVSSGLPNELIECVGTDCLPVELGGTREGIFPYNEEALFSNHPSIS